MVRLVGILGLLCCLTGCADRSADAEAADGSPYHVTTTVGMITDIVRNVAAEKATVTGIIGEGVDPHLYKPTSSDMALLFGDDVDIVFYNGLLLEGKMTDVLVRAAGRGKAVYAVTELLPEDYVRNTDTHHYDPHVWMDVGGWIHAVAAVASSLSEFDPAGAAYYQGNAERYTAELGKLDAYATSVIASIPESQRVLVTAHDAFGYMGRAYGLDVRGIQGLSTESEAGVRDINDLVGFIVERRIAAVFPESSVSRKNMQALIEGAAARGHAVTIGGELYSDAMGPAGSYEGTYIGMIDHNVTTITRALGGTAPAGGLNGKLRH